MIGKKVVIMSDIYEQQGMQGRIIQGKMVCSPFDASEYPLYEVNVERSESEADPRWYKENELRIIETEPFEIPELEFEMIAQMAEEEGAVVKDIKEPFWEQEERITIVNDFIKDKPVDPDDAYARRKSTLEHLNGWCSDINKTNTSNMRPELRCLYNEAQAIMRTIAKEEEKDLCAGE